MSATTSRERWDSYHRRPYALTANICEALRNGDLMKVIAWKFRVHLSTVSMIAVQNNLARRRDAGQRRMRA